MTFNYTCHVINLHVLHLRPLDGLTMAIADKFLVIIPLHQSTSATVEYSISYSNEY